MVCADPRPWEAGAGEGGGMPLLNACLQDPVMVYKFWVWGGVLWGRVVCTEGRAAQGLCPGAPAAKLTWAVSTVVCA